MDKIYITTIDFSKDSDTWDLEYRDELIEYPMKNGKLEIENGKFITPPSKNEIEKRLEALIPEYELPLPAFSAKKVNGKRFYDLARKGKPKDETRVMKISAYKILSYDFPLLKIEVNVGSGTYIRSIAHRLGKEFGLGGIVSELRRISIGKYILPENFDQEVIYHKKEEDFPIRFKEIVIE